MKQTNASWWSGTRIRHSSRRRRAPAVGGVQGNGGRGGSRRSGRKPDQVNEGTGGNRRKIKRGTAVDEGRKETPDRVARHQAD